MSVTSADVARKAGVSRATVSYVVNNTASQTISVATRETILRIAEELGYRPNAAARSLRTGRGNTVVFPFPGERRTFVIAELIEACARALERRDLTLVADFTRYEQVATQLDAWQRLHPAAVIDLLIHHGDPVLVAARKAGITVLSSTAGRGANAESGSDEFGIQTRHTQLEHLLQRGHRRIVAAFPRHLPIDPQVERTYLAQLRRRAARADGSLMVHRLELATEAIRSFAKSQLPGPNAIDAILAFNDDYAIAVITAVTSLGMRVPDDVAVIGVDNTPLGSALVPALTTIAFDFDDYAERLAEAVVAAVAGQPPPQPVALPAHHLVVRESA